VGEVVGAEHHIHVRRSFAHEITIFLGEAATDRDLQLRSPLLELLEPPEMAVELVVGVLPDTAGVQHDDVGRLEIVGRLHAVGNQQPRDPLGVVLVHLAAVRAYEEPTRHAGQCTSHLLGARSPISGPLPRKIAVGPSIRARADESAGSTFCSA